MSGSARQRANAQQLVASDPAASAFVAASAGSGKTKLLTDRLLRLMLSGAAPERIQCLTFTKAAAAEMSLRLQKTLGRWVTLPEPHLAKALQDLQVEPTPAACRTARALFAKVLDLPGGMRIGTIHAFSQSLLRRFPLEAAISPHFELVDERDAEEALTEARETMLATASTDEAQAALRSLAGLCSSEAFGGHVRTLRSDSARLARAARLGMDLERAQRRVLGLTVHTEDEVMERAIAWMGEGALREAAKIVFEQGSGTIAAKADKILTWLAHHSADRRIHWPHWCSAFLKQDGAPYSDNYLVNKKLADKQPHLLDRYREECDRVIAIENDRRALQLTLQRRSDTARLWTVDQHRGTCLHCWSCSGILK